MVQQQLTQYLQDLEQQEKFSGVVLITKGESQLYSGAFGYASRPWQIENTLATRFDTASVTKLFTAVATMQLIDQGELAFDTGVIDFLGLRLTTISNQVTVSQLLTHTSGIGDDVEEEAGERYEDLWKSRPNYAVLNTADFLPQFATKAPNFPPGTSCRYCNCSYVLLGLMIEKVSGLSFREYVRQHIFQPAGMYHSNFFHMGQVHENVAEGADPVRDDDGNVIGWKKNIYAFPPTGSPDSGAHVTAADLDRFLRAVKDGRLLSPEMTAAFFTPQVVYRQMLGWTQKYGYGMWFYLDGEDEMVCCQKEGINAGVSALIRHFPGRDINLILLSNMEDGVWVPVWKIHEMIIEGAFDS
jgi:CubicO group peptidase (beta-lactamase class C family)